MHSSYMLGFWKKKLFILPLISLKLVGMGTAGRRYIWVSIKPPPRDFLMALNERQKV